MTVMASDKGLTVAQIERHVKLFIVSETHLGSSCKHPCPICSMPFIKSRLAGALQCGHKFHQKCVVVRLKTQPTCPVCHVPVQSGPPTSEVPVESPDAGEVWTPSGYPEVDAVFSRLHEALQRQGEANENLAARLEKLDLGLDNYEKVVQGVSDLTM